jgi:hypothetical protein
MNYRSLQNIKSILTEIGLYDPDMSIKYVRIDVNRRNPDTFLGKSPDGTPTFAVKQPIGTVCPLRLMKAIAIAKAKYTLTGDQKYVDIKDRLEKELNNVNGKTNITPTIYHPSTNLSSILKNYYNLNEE